MSKSKRPGAPPETIAKLRDYNEQKHRDALARGSKTALSTERRRQRATARAADPASGGPSPAPPAPEPTPDPTPAAPPTGGERPNGLSVLLNEGLSGVIRRRIGRS